MKRATYLFLGLFAGMTLASSCKAGMETDLQQFLFHRTLIGTSATQLFEVIAQEKAKTESNEARSFLSSAGSVGIECRRDMSANAACSVSLNATKLENGLLVLEGNEAKEIYELLSVDPIEDIVSNLKIFTDEEEQVSFLCVYSLIPNGNRYACSVELKAL